MEEGTRDKDDGKGKERGGGRTEREYVGKEEA